MSFFLFEGSLSIGEQNTLSGEEAHHILNSRRLTVGETLMLQDQKCHRFEVRITDFSKTSLNFEVFQKIVLPETSHLKLELLQALPKEKALHWILQKGTELGVSKILVFGSQYSPKFPRASKQQELRLQRWKRIAWEACKQSGRATPPEILFFSDLPSLLQNLPPCSSQWMLLPQHKFSSQHSQPLEQSNIVNQGSASDSSLAQHHRLLIGAEGGLSCNEEELARSHGMCEMQLGNTVLRTETAAIAAITLFQTVYGDFVQIASPLVS